jgi:hypothetical protein
MTVGHHPFGKNLARVRLQKSSNTFHNSGILPLAAPPARSAMYQSLNEPRIKGTAKRASWTAFALFALPTYQSAESTHQSFYVVLDVGGSESKKRQFRKEVAKLPPRPPKVIWVDATPKESGSEA